MLFYAEILSIVLAIFGVALVCFNGSTTLEFNPAGDLLALLAALCWGFYSMFISILNKKSYDKICSTRRIFFFAVLFMIPLTLAGTALMQSHVAESGSLPASNFIILYHG